MAIQDYLLIKSTELFHKHAFAKHEYE